MSDFEVGAEVGPVVLRSLPSGDFWDSPNWRQSWRLTWVRRYLYESHRWYFEQGWVEARFDFENDLYELAAEDLERHYSFQLREDLRNRCLTEVWKRTANEEPYYGRFAHDEFQGKGQRKGRYTSFPAIDPSDFDPDRHPDS